MVSRLVAVAAVTVERARAGVRLQWGALTDWDGGWFLAIVEHGYGHGPIPARWTVGNWSRWPFFPLYPGLTRVVILTGVPSRVAIVAVNNVAFLVALAGLYRLAARHIGTDGAVWAVWAMVLFPGSITSVMGHSGGLFLAGSIWAFVWVDEDRSTLARLAAAVAVARAPTGSWCWWRSCRPPSPPPTGAVPCGDRSWRSPAHRWCSWWPLRSIATGRN